MDNGSYSKTHTTQSKKLGTTGHQRFEIFIWSSSIPFFPNLFQTSPKNHGVSAFFRPVAATWNPKVLHWPPTTPMMRQQPQWQQRRRRFFDAFGEVWKPRWVGDVLCCWPKKGNPKVSWLRSADDFWKIVQTNGMYWQVEYDTSITMAYDYMMNESYAWLCYHQPNLIADSKNILTVMHKFFER